MNLKFLSMVQMMENDDSHPFPGTWRESKASLVETK